MSYTREFLMQCDKENLVEVIFAHRDLVNAIARNNAMLAEKLPHVASAKDAETLVSMWGEANSELAKGVDGRIAMAIGLASNRLN